MSFSSYQGGRAIEIFTAQGKDPLSKVLSQGGSNVQKDFDSVLKGYVIVLSGSPATTRLQLHKAKKSLGIQHHTLCYHIMIPADARVILELNVTDNDRCKRKLQFSTTYKDVSVTSMLAKVPLTTVAYNEWVWLCIDMETYVSRLWSQHYDILDGVSMSGTCRVRRVFTLRDTPTGQGDIPSSWHPPPSAPRSTMVTLDGHALPHKMAAKQTKDTVHTHIAFGEKIPIPQHLLTSNTGSKRTAESKIDRVSSLQPVTSSIKPMTSSIQPMTSSTKPVTSSMTSPLHPPVTSSIQQKSSHHDSISSEDLDKDIELAITALSGSNIHQDQLGSDTKSPDINRAIPICDTVSLGHDTVSLGRDPMSPRNDTVSSTTDTKSVRGCYSYESPPHSATRRTSLEGSKTTPKKTTPITSIRGAKLDDDFISIESLSNTEEYDYQRYQTSSNSSDDEATPSNHTHTNMADTLMTGTLLAHKHALETTPIHDTIDISKMGGSISPKPIRLATPTHDLSDEVELLYDPDLNCFYDPAHNKYYQLKNT